MSEESYSVLAHVYDSLNSHVDYGQLCDGIEACFEKYLSKKPELVLDLACGTGKLTAELARRGYDMIGVDASVDMLMDARNNTEGLDVLLLEQDMCHFELYGTVGAVVCTYDSLNYLTGDGELEQCFSLVHNYLDPGGLFVFDMNMPEKFRDYYAQKDFILESEDETVFCGWQSDYDEKSALCRFILTIFERNPDGSYRKSCEEQTERAYSSEMIRETLKKTGFELLMCSPTLPDQIQGADVSGGRLYFAARCLK